MPTILANAVANESLPWWGQLGVAGIVLVILGFVLKHTIPEIVKEFREDSREQRNLFANESRAQRDAFSAAHNRDREEHSKRLDSMTQAFREEIAAERSFLVTTFRRGGDAH